MLHRILAGALLCALPAVALAQQAPAPAGPVASTIVEAGPLTTELIKLAAIAIGVLGSWAIIELKKYLGVKGDTERAALSEPIFQNALAFGQAITGQLPHSIDAKNAIVAAAANYAVQALADTLKKVDRAHVENMLLARLEANVSAQSPEVTATAAAPMPTTVQKPVEAVPVPVPIPVAPPGAAT